MDSVQIDLTNGKRITFDCESMNMEVVQAFLADHGDDSTLAINGFDNVTGDIAGSSYIANDGNTLILHRSDVVSIEVA